MAVLVVLGVSVLTTFSRARGDERDHSSGAGGESFAVSCSADIAPPGGDGNVGVADLLMIINNWGACAGACPPACAADLSGDCNVGVADLLTVINSWGACACPPAGPEPNDTCATFTNLNTVGSNQLVTFSAANLHDGDDVDIYRIRALETDSTCSCCDGGFCFDEDFMLRIRLTVPIVSSVAFQFCTGATCDSVATNCITIQPGVTGQLTWIFDGSCSGPADEYFVFVRVRAQGSDVGCGNYEISYDFEPGCF